MHWCYIVTATRRFPDHAAQAQYAQHPKSIFGKLAVNKREDAVLEARRRTLMA